MSTVVIAEISETALDVDAHRRAVSVPAAGGQVVFCGVVRDHDHGAAVTVLEYQGHPSAGEVLESVVATFAAEPEVLAIAVSHRVGVLAIGDVALVAAVSTAHRAEAFEVCARLVDEVKRQLPIWKRQVLGDGSEEWVNSP